MLLHSLELDNKNICFLFCKVQCKPYSFKKQSGSNSFFHKCFIKLHVYLFCSNILSLTPKKGFRNQIHYPN